MWRHFKDIEDCKLVDNYVDKNYYNVLYMSGIFRKPYEKNTIICILIFIQPIAYISLLAFQLTTFIRATISIYGINIQLFCQNVHMILLLQVAVIALLSCLWNKSKIFDILKLAAMDFFDYEEPDVIGEELLRSKMKKECRQLAVIPIGVVACVGALLLMASTLDFNLGSYDFNSTTSILDYQLLFPYTKNPYYVADGFGYYFAMLMQLLMGYVMSAIVGGGVFSLIHIAESVILQMKILNNSLDNMDKRVECMYTQLFGMMDPNSLKSLRYNSRYVYCYIICLRKNFQHHQVILRAFRLIEDITSVPIACSYFTGTIVIPLSFISAGSVKELPGTSIASVILCIVEIAYMFLFSTIGQRFTDLSTELRDKVYYTRWYMCSEEVKTSLMIFQAMALKPLTLIVSWVVPVNMETFATVMKSAYSFYNLANAVHVK